MNKPLTQAEVECDFEITSSPRYVLASKLFRDDFVPEHQEHDSIDEPARRQRASRAGDRALTVWIIFLTLIVLVIDAAQFVH